MISIRRTQLYGVLGQSARIKNCHICSTPMKGKNIIKGFTNYCWCTKCKEMVEIKLPDKDNANTNIPTQTNEGDKSGNN